MQHTGRVSLSFIKSFCEIRVLFPVWAHFSTKMEQKPVESSERFAAHTTSHSNFKDATNPSLILSVMWMTDRPGWSAGGRTDPSCSLLWLLCMRVCVCFSISCFFFFFFKDKFSAKHVDAAWNYHSLTVRFLPLPTGGMLMFKGIDMSSLTCTSQWHLNLKLQLPCDSSHYCCT